MLTNLGAVNALRFVCFFVFRIVLTMFDHFNTNAGALKLQSNKLPYIHIRVLLAFAKIAVK